jgi:hypothetical protein
MFLSPPHTEHMQPVSHLNLLGVEEPVYSWTAEESVQTSHATGMLENGKIRPNRAACQPDRATNNEEEYCSYYVAM